MSEPGVGPHGSWRSPFTAAMIASGERWLGETRLVDGAAYWIETRPAEGGREVVMRSLPFTDPMDVTPPGFNVRTKVHEYGGGAYWADATAVFFASFADQRIYRQEGPGAGPRPITPETGGAVRYADGVVTPDGRLTICVRERHEGDVVTNELVALPADGSDEPRTIAGGRDFFSFPRLSPDGGRLAWTCWDHPRMPWDGTELWVAHVGNDGTLDSPRLVAGGPEESIFQPSWSPDGALHFVSDRTGWWNLYREGRAGPLVAMDAEFGVPQWVFGNSTYAFLGDGRIACTYDLDATGHLAVLDPGSGELVELDLPFTAFEPYLAAEGDRLLFVASSPSMPRAVVSLDFTTRGVEVLHSASDLEVDEAYVSVPQPISFPTDGGEEAHALFYPPANAVFVAPEGELPPLIVHAHGGPTDHHVVRFDIDTQFWTSRGFAVADVNYRGSSGYGREYRRRLRESWGIVDIADCVNAARHLTDAGRVDGRRMAVRGGSAGGYVVLCAVTFHDVFAAGASYFGVADLEGLARDTHKFESRYLDLLVGPYPEAADAYRARSPINFTSQLSCPLILLQGLEDEIVPPSQAEMMIEALDAKGLPYAYLAFEGEQHGFRRAENVQRSLEAELAFFGRVLGFEPADDLPPLDVKNL